MSRISIIDLEIYCRVGVPDEERARPQRLLVTVDMEYDFSSAATSDRIGRTIDYSEVSKKLLKFDQRRSWKIIESLATDISKAIQTEFNPEKVTVEVKKFSVPQAQYVSVTVSAQRPAVEYVKRPWWLRRWY
jgi:FolB domain-containing protein